MYFNDCYLCKYLTFCELGDSGSYVCTITGITRGCTEFATDCQEYCEDREE